MLNPSFVSFFLMYLSSFLVVMSCNEWFLMWMGLEINMISFIMMIYNKFNSFNIESCLKYFFIQSIGSLMIMMMLYLDMNMNFWFSMILSYKIGGGPFFFWFPSISENISWISLFFLMSFQKLIPLMVVSMFLSKVIWLLSLISLMVGVMGSMNQMKLKRLMAYSSVHHIGWIMISLMISNKLWMIYLILYTIMMLNIFMYLNEFKISLFSQINNLKEKIIIMLSLLNMGGIPPMLGFFLKWIMLYSMIHFDKSLVFLLVVFSVMMLYIYFRLIYDYFLGNKSLNTFYLKNINIFYMNKFDIIFFFSFGMGSLMGMLMIFYYIKMMILLTFKVKNGSNMNLQFIIIMILLLYYSILNLQFNVY